jgi:glycosyltransferase involved in cell wall biosynthesis
MKDPSIILDDLKDYGAKDIYRHSRTSSLKDPFLSLDWIKAMKEYDVLHTWGRQTAMAPSSGKPYVATTVGADIMGACGEVEMTVPPREMYVRGFRDAKHVIFQDPGIFDYTRRLKLNNAVLIPFPIDVDKYSPRETPLRDELLDRYGCEMILLNPARQDWYWKGSDKMIDAFAKFIKDEKSNAHLLLAEWGVDVGRSTELISELGISEQAHFIPAMSKTRLVQYYNAVDIILDTFNHTNFMYQGFGTSTLEALACGKPVITDFIPERLQEHYPGDIPARSAKSVDEITGRLVELNDKDRILSIGKQSREWILKYFNGRELTDKYMEYYENSMG